LTVPRGSEAEIRKARLLQAERTRAIDSYRDIKQKRLELMEAQKVQEKAMKGRKNKKRNREEENHQYQPE
jgi:hypothetical protein